MMMPIIVRPVCWWARVYAAIPSAAVVVLVPPPGASALSENWSTLKWLGRICSPISGVLSGLQVELLKNWSATPMPTDVGAEKNPLSAVIARHHFESTASPMLQSAPMLPDLSRMMYMSSGSGSALAVVAAQASLLSSLGA